METPLGVSAQQWRKGVCPFFGRLYEGAGFRRRAPFGSYRADPLSVFMEKPLA